MTDESTSQDQPDDIGADLRAALEGYKEPATPDTTDDDEASQEAAEAEQEASEEDAGDERPAKAASDDAAEGADSEETGEDESDQDEDEGEIQEDDSADQPPIEPPARLSEAHKELFKSLPREAQEFLADRHREMEADYTKKTEENANLRKTAEAFNAAVEPYKAYIASLGATPEQAVSVLLAADYKLRTGTAEQKSHYLAQLAKSYGVNLTDLVPDEEDDDIDPIERKVNERFDRLEQTIQQQTQQAQRQIQQDAESQIQAFAEAKDEAGNPTHPHFDQVRKLMGQFVEADPNMDLETAYQNAVWANPELRQQQLEQQRASLKPTTPADDTAKKKIAERAAKVAKAKKAAAAVTGRSTPPGKPAKPERDLRGEITSAWEQFSSD